MSPNVFIYENYIDRPQILDLKKIIQDFRNGFYKNHGIIKQYSHKSSSQTMKGIVIGLEPST